MPQAGIDIASGTGNTTLITTAAGEHFWADINLIPSDTGEFELLSGATVIWHVQVGAAGGSYSPPTTLRSVAAGDDLILNRVGTMAMGGSIDYRVK